MDRGYVVSRWAALGLVGLVAAALAAGPATAEENVFYHDVNLRLIGGLFLGDDPTQARDLELYLGTRDGTWRKHVLGWAGRLMVGWREDRQRAYNQIDHEGILTQIEDRGPTIRLAVDMTINADPWVPGGPARYELDLKRDGNQISGTFTGTFKGQPVKGKVAGFVRDKLWPSPDTQYKPRAPEEHPRVIFRTEDLPALRERAKTPEGKAILARLDALLEGPFTLWHGMGYAFKYQLTGDPKWAEEAKRYVEMARQGTPQKDGRYSYARPGGKLRAGSSYAAVAMAYDMCYDAWDPAYRKTLATEIQEKVFPGLVIKTGGGQHSPRSNHYMAWNGGAGTTILAIEGDPGTDPEIIARCNRIFRQRAKRGFHDGYGSKAYFFEGHHCGRLSTNTGFSAYLQALRVAAGEDWITNYEPARWMLSKWVYEIVRHGGRIDNLQRGMYARGFDRGGMSGGGDFAQGFGICPEAHRPAVLWFYNHTVEPGPDKTYDVITYPHRAVYAFVNWPIGVREQNPDDTWPKVLHDELAEYFLFRSGWRGDGDIIVTLIGGEHRPYPKACALVCGPGIKATFPGKWTDWKQADLHDGKDGTYVVSKGGSSFAVDFSGKSGAPALIAAAGPGAGGKASSPPGTKTTTVTAGGHAITVMTLQKDEAPTVKVQGDRVIVGDQTLRFDGKKIVFGG